MSDNKVVFLTFIISGTKYREPDLPITLPPSYNVLIQNLSEKLQLSQSIIV